MNTFGKLAILALLTALAGPSFAEADLYIGGDSNINVQTGDNTAIGMGQNVTVAQDIGSVHGNVHIGGDNEIDVRTGDNTAIAMGQEVTVTQTIGSITSH